MEKKLKVIHPVLRHRVHVLNMKQRVSLWRFVSAGGTNRSPPPPT